VGGADAAPAPGRAQDELSRLARDIGREAIDEDQFLVQASEFLANTPEMAAVVWADNSFTLRWIAPYEESRLTVGSGLSGVSASSAGAYRRPLCDEPALPAGIRRVAF
jgi:hypothetical protein